MGADPSHPQSVLDWLVKRKRYPMVEEVTDRMLEILVGGHEYVAVFYQGPSCGEDQDDDGKGTVKGFPNQLFPVLKCV